MPSLNSRLPAGRISSVSIRSGCIFWFQRCVWGFASRAVREFLGTPAFAASRHCGELWAGTFARRSQNGYRRESNQMRFVTFASGLRAAAKSDSDSEGMWVPPPPTVPGSGIVYRKVLKIGIFGHCFISLAQAMSKKKGSRSPSLCQTPPPAALLGIPRTTSKQSSLSRGAISVDACWTGGEPSGQSIANWTGRNFRRGQLRLVYCCE